VLNIFKLVECTSCIPVCSKAPSIEVDSYCTQLPLFAKSVRDISSQLRKQMLTATVVCLQRRFAPKTGHRLHSEFHQSSDGRSSDLNGASMAAGNYKQSLDVMDGKKERTHVMYWLLSLPGWARKYASGVSKADCPGSISYRLGCCCPEHRVGLQTSHRQRHLSKMFKPNVWGPR
jgi:hypothetical protein